MNRKRPAQSATPKMPLPLPQRIPAGKTAEICYEMIGTDSRFSALRGCHSPSRNRWASLRCTHPTAAFLRWKRNSSICITFCFVPYGRGIGLFLLSRKPTFPEHNGISRSPQYRKLLAEHQPFWNKVHRTQHDRKLPKCSLAHRERASCPAELRYLVYHMDLHSVGRDPSQVLCQFGPESPFGFGQKLAWQAEPCISPFFQQGQTHRKKGPRFHEYVNSVRSCCSWIGLVLAPYPGYSSSCVSWLPFSFTKSVGFAALHPPYDFPMRF